MAGNTFGTLFTVTSFGESHGKAIGCIVDGCPPGLELVEADLQPWLDKRKPGTSKFTTQRREDDEVEIMSGVFEGRTTGTPIMLLIRNKDQRSRDYGKIADTFRPGHADYTYHQKYGFRDYRGGGRSSARETATRVAAGGIARKWLQQRYGITIRGWLNQMGDITASTFDEAEIDNNPFFSPDASIVPEMEALIEKLRRDGDSVGAKISVMARGVPAGWGEPVYGKLDSELASALMSINAVKGVEIGDGFKSVSQLGSEHRDEITTDGFVGNSAGGVLGGISSGQDVVAHIALKPTSSIRVPGRSVDRAGLPTEVVTTGRHDPCVGVRAAPIAEAMLAIVLMDQALRHRGQNADVDSGLADIPSGS